MNRRSCLFSVKFTWAAFHEPKLPPYLDDFNVERENFPDFSSYVQWNKNKQRNILEDHFTVDIEVVVTEKASEIKSFIIPKNGSAKIVVP